MSVSSQQTQTLIDLKDLTRALLDKLDKLNTELNTEEVQSFIHNEFLSCCKQNDGRNGVAWSRLALFIFDRE